MTRDGKAFVMTIDSDVEDLKVDENDKCDDINPEFNFSVDSLEVVNDNNGWTFEKVKAMFCGNKLRDSIDDVIKARVEKEMPRLSAIMSEMEESDCGEEDSMSEVTEFSPKHDDRKEPEDRVVEKRKLDFFADDLSIGHESEAQYFTEINLSRPIIKGLAEMGFVCPTKIQSATIPLALAGKDICASAVTGSGKTAAFLLPVCERLLHRQKTAATRVLILMPTRELAAQCFSVAIKLAKYTDITFALCTGGMSAQQQELELKKRPDVVIATPGRIIDHMLNSGSFGLDSLEILVLDEADRMLEEGFQAELNEIIKDCPRSRQTLLFSATMTDDVDQLVSLSLVRPVRLFIDSNQSVANNLIQEFIRIRSHSGVNNENNDTLKKYRAAIILALCKRSFHSRTMIFFSSKAECHQMKVLFGLNGLNASELHGNLTQLQRIESLEAFREGKVHFLLATDLAGRGLDIVGVDTVINASMPSTYSKYVHRVGRTARNQRSGRAISIVEEKERKIVKMVMKNLKPGQVVKQRVVPNEIVVKYLKKISQTEGIVTRILQDERKEKEVEMSLKKAENMLEYEREIFSRPKRAWFQGTDIKATAQSNFKSIDSSMDKEACDDNELETELRKAAQQQKSKRPTNSGLSRKQKRRKAFAGDENEQKQLIKDQRSQKLAAKMAKKAARRT